MDIVSENSETREVSADVQTPDSLVGVKEPVAERVDNLSALGVSQGAAPEVTIEQRHKDAFLDCLVTGDRYRETVELFGGRIKLVLRSRTLEETDAIMSHLQHLAVTKIITSDYEYSEVSRLSMITAQVERMNEVVYPELEKPLFAVDHGDHVDEPGWLKALRGWQSKPEAIVAAISAAIAEFEARYWAMIRKSSDINFWKPGESTGR